MRNSLLKIIIIILIGVMMLSLNNTICAAFDTGQYEPSNPNESDIEPMKKIGETIVGIVRGVGIIASVATLIVLGIKYMTGSVEERAQYKKTMIPYLIGAFMVFAITFFLSIVIEIAEQI